MLQKLRIGIWLCVVILRIFQIIQKIIHNIILLLHEEASLVVVAWRAKDSSGDFGAGVLILDLSKRLQ